MRLLGISGSLRQGSYNRALLEAAAAEVACGDVEFVLWRGLADIPAYSEDLATVPPSVEMLRRALAEADAVLIATPEYNASVPGALKNALDWVSTPLPRSALRNKPVAVIGASQGMFGAVWAQADMRKILKAIGALVDDRELCVARAHEAFTDDGRLHDPVLAARLRAIVNDLCEPVVQAA
jgi:chromate reductase, NAD(P)H dehydrogenase (quinone)